MRTQPGAGVNRVGKHGDFDVRGQNVSRWHSKGV